MIAPPVSPSPPPTKEPTGPNAPRQPSSSSRQSCPLTSLGDSPRNHHREPPKNRNGGYKAPLACGPGGRASHLKCQGKTISPFYPLFITWYPNSQRPPAPCSATRTLNSPSTFIRRLLPAMGSRSRTRAPLEQKAQELEGVRAESNLSSEKLRKSQAELRTSKSRTSGG